MISPRTKASTRAAMDLPRSRSALVSLMPANLYLMTVLVKCRVRDRLIAVSTAMSRLLVRLSGGGELGRPLPQPEFLDFPGSRLRQGSEYDAPRTLEVRQPLAAPLDDGLLGYRSNTGLQTYKGTGTLPPVRMWHRDHRRFHDLRVPIQQLLHLETR